MRAQGQIDPGNAPEDQSAAEQKAKAQEQKSKLGPKGGEKRIINNGRVEKGLGGPDTKTKGAEAFRKAGKGGSTKPGDNKGEGSYGTGVYKKGGEKNAPSGEKATTKNSAAEKATVKGFNPQPDPPGKGMKAGAGGIRTQPTISTPRQARAAVLSAIGTLQEKQKQPEKEKQQKEKTYGKAKPPGQLGSKQASGGPLVGPAVGKAIGNPANDSNEDKAAKKKLSPEDIKKAQSGLPGERSDKGTIKPGSNAGERAVADSGKTKLKKKGLSPEDRKKAADALGEALDEDSGGGTITPGTPNREPPNLQKKAAYAPSDGSGETISPGASATPRPKLKKKGLSSDYSGAGAPFTVPGTKLNWREKPVWVDKPGEEKREAEWGPGKPGEETKKTKRGRASQTGTPKPK